MRHVLASVLCLLLLGPVGGRAVPHEPSDHPDSPAAIVLTNGNVLVGQVAPVGDHYELTAPGTAIRVHRADVDFVAPSLVEAYERQRANASHLTADIHLQLARWCIRHKLWPQAAREIVDARGRAPDHPQVSHLERELAAASATRLLPVEALPQVAVESPLTDSPDQEKLQLNDLPRGAVEQFVRRVQPVLVNNCTAGGCHRVDGPSEFQLSRALIYDHGNRASTRQNLAATLAQIDCESPRDSPLLKMSLLSHGGTDRAALPAHRQQLYQQLVRWVEVVAETKPEPPSVAKVAYITPVPHAPLRPKVRRGAFGAQYPRARGRHGPVDVQFGLERREIESAAAALTPETEAE